MKPHLSMTLALALVACSGERPFRLISDAQAPADAAEDLAFDAASPRDTTVDAPFDAPFDAPLSDAPFDALSDAPVDATPTNFTVTSLGAEPDWRVERVWTVSAPLGLRAEDTPRWGDFHDVFAAPNHGYSVRTDQTAHLRPHDGPYGAEVDLALPRAGLRAQTVFTAHDFYAPQAVYFVVLLTAAPGAPRGSTPDGADRPMIPVASFPILFDGPILRDGSVYDPNMGTTLDAPLTAFSGDWQGHTHVYYLLAEDHEYAPPTVPIAGRFEWIPTIRDASGRGLRLRVPIEVRCTDGDRDIPQCRALDAGAPSPIGGPCTADDQCQSGVCAADLPGGYCTFRCEHVGDACTEGGVCGPLRGDGDTNPLCLRPCALGCRAGYTCQMFEHVSACLPSA